MRLLLDTHIFLWYISADAQLPVALRDAVGDTSNQVYLSAVSVWEVTIKYALGKLLLPGSPAEYLPQQRIAHQIDSLPVEEASLVYLSGLPPLHRDPFDRLLIAQALQHDLVLVTVDEAIRAYRVPLLPPV